MVCGKNRFLLSVMLCSSVLYAPKKDLKKERYDQSKKSIVIHATDSFCEIKRKIEDALGGRSGVTDCLAGYCLGMKQCGCGGKLEISRDGSSNALKTDTKS